MPTTSAFGHLLSVRIGQVNCPVLALELVNQTVNDGVAHSKNPRKCAYHVTFDLDLDLEHILDAR